MNLVLFIKKHKYGCNHVYIIHIIDGHRLFLNLLIHTRTPRCETTTYYSELIIHMYVYAYIMRQKLIRERGFEKNKSMEILYKTY